MTRFVVTCEVCGTVELPPEELVVVRRSRHLHYAFVHCGGVQVRQASRRQVVYLEAAGSDSVEVRRY